MLTQAKMDLTISIVNWNVKEYLGPCLDSIFKYSDGIAFEVFVVDNASQDDSVEMVRKNFPSVSVIANTENIGYGRAHNQIIPQAQGKYILFLNPDTELLPGALSRILGFMEKHPEAGAVRCRELTKKEDVAREAVLLKKSSLLKHDLFRLLYKILPNRLTASWYAQFVAQSVALSRGVDIFGEEVALEGGLLLVRSKALRGTGGFEPRFFHGEEGIDLTRRLKKNGWKLYHLPTVKIIHYSLKSLEKLTDKEIETLRRDGKDSYVFSN